MKQFDRSGEDSSRRYDCSLARHLIRQCRGCFYSKATSRAFTRDEGSLLSKQGVLRRAVNILCIRVPRLILRRHFDEVLLQFPWFRREEGNWHRNAAVKGVMRHLVADFLSSLCLERI